MLRAIILYFAKLSWAQTLITRWKFAWRMASRFIAGEKREDAIQAIRGLNEKGINATIDFLGENVTTIDETRTSANEVITMMKMLDEAGLHANVSVKLSQLGLCMDPVICQENIRSILDTAKKCNNFLRIDMEDATLTTPTLDIYRWARHQGYENVGVVVQSYLYRTADDIRSLAALGVKVRLCKGAYKEPSTVAFPKKIDVDHNFDVIVDMLFDIVKQNGTPIISENGRIPPIPGIATHDIKRIKYAQDKAHLLGLPNNAMEFQMLYGIRRDLQEELTAAGYPVRVYVPYGTRWYPYFMRRLAERPANVWFFISNYFKK